METPTVATSPNTFFWDGDALLAEFDVNGQRQVDYVYLPGTIDHPFDPATLHTAAGIRGIVSHAARLSYWRTLFDDPVDGPWVDSGIEFGRLYQQCRH